MSLAISPYASYGVYSVPYASRAAQAYGAEKAQAAQSGQPAAVWGLRKAAQVDTPVQPVTPARPVFGQEDLAQSALRRYASDPAAMAVRMRIQYPQESGQAEKAQVQLPGQEKAAQAQIPGQPKDAQVQLPGQAKADQAQAPDQELKSAQEVMEEGECQTCKERKYQDGSDDPGVSFKSPTRINPDQVASAVRGHENEHVVREQAKARQEGRRVVSQSVTIHTDICPECGKVYVSGGTTRTVTKAGDSQQSQNQQQDPEAQSPFSAVA